MTIQLPARAPTIKEETLVGRPSKNGAESALFPKGKSRDKVARFVGVGHDTLAKAEKVVEAAEKNPQKYVALLRKVDSGTVSINSAYQKVKRDESKPVIPRALLKVGLVLANHK